MPEVNLLVGILIKPLVLVLCFVVIIFLWRYRRHPSYQFFFISFILFYIGESFCAIDVYLLHRMSFCNEGLHDIFMVLSFSIMGVAGYKFFSNNFRCFNFSCKNYWDCQVTPLECSNSGRYGTFLGWIVLGVASIGILPLLVPGGVVKESLQAGMDGKVISTYIYDRTIALSIVQQKALPMIGIILLVLSGLRYFVVKRLDIATIWLISFGAGFLSFSIIRLVLIHLFYSRLDLANLLEESTEALFVVLFAIWVRNAVKYTSVGKNSRPSG